MALILAVQLQIGLFFAPQDDCVTPGYFHAFTQQAFRIMTFSLGTFHTLGVALCWPFSYFCS